MEKKYIELLEKRETSKFNINDAFELLMQLKTERSNWDTQAAKGWKIRNNDLPLSDTLTSYEKYDDKFYVDNWILKANTWKKSMLSTGDVFIDVKSYNGIDDESLELLENEINYCMDSQNMFRNSSEVIADMLYTGFGVSRILWDTERITKFWKTGQPKLEHIDSRRIWFESLDSRIQEVKSIFHKETFKTEKLQKMFPEHADQIEETAQVSAEGEHSQTRDRTSVYTYQYLVEKKVEQVEVKDRDTGKSWMYTKEEYDDYLDNGGTFPEGVIVSQPVSAKIDMVFQAMFTQDEIILVKPEYIGEHFSYKFFPGLTQKDSQYPYGMTFYLKDLQEISIILMTLLTIQSVKTNKPMPVLEEGALVNQANFLLNHWKQDAVAIVDPQWRESHPGEQPVDWKNPPTNANIPMALYDIINNAIKDYSGAVDVARGEQEYSGQSGVLAAQLQSAAKTYTKSEEDDFGNYIRDIAETLKNYIVRFRSYPHKIKGLDLETGRQTPRTVNTNPENSLEAESYYCVPIIQIDPEALRQAEQEQAMALFQKGLMGKLDTLKRIDVNNPERVYENLLREQGLEEIANAVQENPELIQVIQEYLQSKEGNVPEGTSRKEDTNEQREGNTERGQSTRQEQNRATQNSRQAY